ncbi:MAG: phosphoglycerate mutase [Pseudomonas sp.]|nr:phosphoglycerate mutase [Pseudomonas sp.]
MTPTPNRKTLYLIRHGETDWNAQKRLQGRKDIPLNALGRRQAAEAGLCLKWLLGEASHVDFVASPLLRTRETMSILRECMGLPAEDYRHDQRLLEIDFGDWEGLTWAEIEAQQPLLHSAREADPFGFIVPNGENYPMVFERITSALASLQRDTVVVAHAGVLRAVLALLGGVDAQRIPHIEIPQGKVLLLREGEFVWLQASSALDGQ